MSRPSERTRWRARFDRLVVALALLAVWKFAAVASGAFWLAPPEAVAWRLLAMLRSGDLLGNAAYTVEAAVLGFVIGGVPGLILPLLLRRLPAATAILDPYLTAGYGLPKLALVPLLVVWFGIGIGSKVALVALVTFFLVYFSAQAGVRAVSPQLVAAGRVLGATERQLAVHIVWPSAIPYIFAGFRIALPYAVGGAAVAELVSSNRGLGYIIQSGATDFDTATSLAAVVALSVISFAVAALVNGAEALLLRCRPGTLDSAIIGKDT
jgi:NitT/TauT family transport system permease protein